MDIKNLLKLARKMELDDKALHDQNLINLDFGKCVQMFSYLAENGLSFDALPKEARKNASRIFLMSIANLEPKGSFYRRTAVNLLKDIMVVRT